MAYKVVSVTVTTSGLYVVYCTKLVKSCVSVNVVFQMETYTRDKKKAGALKQVTRVRAWELL